jgi:Dolichyl-phosphate-mannose-protein mannosyltransferase
MVDELDRAAWRVVVAAIVVGTALRVAEAAQGHAFGFDDSMLAINIVSRSAAQLARPLDFQQSAPILFLWLDRALVDLAGASTIVLCLVPVIGGIAVLPLTWVVGRRLVGAPAAAWTTALLAVSPLAVDYTDRPKPYILDAAIALALIALTLRVLREPERRTRWAALAVAGVLSIGLSTPAILTLAACGVTLLMTPSIRRPYGTWVIALGVLWVAVAAGNYIAFERAASNDPYLRRFWDPIFFTPGAPDLAARVRLVFSSYVENLFFGTTVRPPIAFRVVAIVLAVVGAARAWRRPGPWALMLLVGPLAFAMIASALRAYPPSDRTWLFTAPMVALLAAYGVVAIGDLVPLPFRRAVLVGVGAATLMLPAWQSWLAFRATLQPDDFETAVRTWRASDRPGEPVYVFARDAIRWTYYTTNWAAPDTARLDWLLGAARAIGPNSGNAPPRGHPVHDEGDTMVYAGAGGAELIGDPTGMEDLMNVAREPRPDTGWGDNEARRIAAAANPNIWLFLRYCPPSVDSELVVASIRRGGRVTAVRRVADVRLYQLQFDRTALARPAATGAIH